MVAGANRDGVCLLEFTDRRMLETQFVTVRTRFRSSVVPGTNEHLEQLKDELARYFAHWIAGSERFELAAPQTLPIVNLRFRRPGLTEAERHAIHEAIVLEVTRDGRRWISTTSVNGKSVSPVCWPVRLHAVSPCRAR